MLTDSHIDSVTRFVLTDAHTHNVPFCVHRHNVTRCVLTDSHTMSHVLCSQMHTQTKCHTFCAHRRTHTHKMSHVLCSQTHTQTLPHLYSKHTDIFTLLLTDSQTLKKKNADRCTHIHFQTCADRRTRTPSHLCSQMHTQARRCHTCAHKYTHR